MATIDVLDAVGATQTIAKVAATGQAAMADSLPVAIASDQTLPLPIGAATETTLDDIKTAVEALAAGDPPTETTLATLATEATLAAQSAKLPASLGPKAGASSLSVVESTPTTVTIVSLQTNATGTTYNAFASQACEQLDLVNTQSGAVDLEVRRGASGNTIIVPGGSSRMFIGITNASDLQVRRSDTSNTQVTFTAEAIKA